MEQGERRMTYEEKLDEALEWQKQQTEKDRRIKELEAQIEKMKCCENCRWEEPSSFCDNCKRLEGQIFADTLTSDNWEIKEK